MSFLCAHPLFWAQEQHEWKFNSEVGRLELVLRQAYQVGERHDEQDGPDHRADARRGPERGLGIGHVRKWGRGGYIGILWVRDPYQIPGGIGVDWKITP